jgi:protein phosphatase PTC7
MNKVAMKWLTASVGLVLLIALDCQGFSPSFSQNVVTFSISSTESWSSTRLFLEPLAQEGEWTAYLDDQNTGLVYYFNRQTGEARWEPPTSTFPQVTLDAAQLFVAKSKQRQYREAQQEVAVAKARKEKKSFSLFGGETERKVESRMQQQNPAQEDRKGFGFFGGGDSANVLEKDEPKVVEQEKRFSFFGKAKDDAVEEVKVEEDEKRKRRFSIFQRGASEDEVESRVNGDAGAIVAAPVPAPVRIMEPTPIKEKPEVDVDVTPIKYDSGGFVLPHPAKARWGGEDAIFLKGLSFGVFDGVSGASKLDGVPLYSVTLAKELKSAMDKEQSYSIKEITQILSDAASFADKSATGASTAVVGSLNADGDLSVLNLGDSVCMVIRDGKIVAKTREILHYFDCPYQLSEDSPDRPRDGTKLNIRVQKGDVILMGSDGIFDNLTEKQILDFVERNSRFKAATLSRKICDLSRRVSLNGNAETPYAALAKRNGVPDYPDGVGGKVDDVSAVVVKCI